jgi:hypothetical protein
MDSADGGFDSEETLFSFSLKDNQSYRRKKSIVPQLQLRQTFLVKKKKRAMREKNLIALKKSA